MENPSVDRLRALFDYDAETGLLTWKARDRNLTGVEAGGVDARMGYRRVKIAGRLWLAHRVVVAMTSGAWPEGEVDHINGERDDNRIANLRVVPRAENAKNKARYRNNQSGVAGVYWHRQHRKWCAAVQVDGKRKTLGVFRDIGAAKAARERATAALAFHPNHGRDGGV